MKLLTILYFLFAMLALPSQANDAALYDPKPNKDSSFVRFLNVSGTAKSLLINGKKTNATMPLSVSSYIALDSGTYNFTIESISKEITFDSNKKLTIFIDDNSIRSVIQDKANTKKKANISFFNLSNIDLSLTTTKSNKTVFENVQANEISTRNINPMKLDFSIKNNGETIASTPLISLKRGQASDIIVFNTVLGNKITISESEW
ncbi:alginate O-acetyltransferase AlgF [Vibrio kasasachensis]|uniref:alginate O-acetyltransferase AlgF n=1 Tax=Vibrio kasasachensis TaxID=2910248 RepID=UPI003D0CC3B2